MRQPIPRLDSSQREAALRAPTLAGDMPELAGLARQAVAQSAWLLASRRAALLCIPLDTGAEPASPIQSFGRGSAADPRPWQAHGAEASLLAELRVTAAAIAREIVPLWPHHASPPRLGLISDGTGLGFSPEDPWPLAPGWIARQAHGQTRMTQIVGFSPFGTWTTLTAARAPGARAEGKQRR